MKNSADRKTTIEAFVFLFLVTFAVGARLWFRDVPNFAPVAAVSLFAGYYFRNRLLAFATPITTMLICDFLIGGYELVVMCAVYGSFAMPVLLSGFLRHRPSFMRIAASTVAMSCLFFLVSNAAVWLVWDSGRFDQLLPCYTRALPFFRYTLLGDGVFATALFGSHALITRIVPQFSRRTEGSEALAVR